MPSIPCPLLLGSAAAERKPSEAGRSCTDSALCGNELGRKVHPRTVGEQERTLLGIVALCTTTLISSGELRAQAKRTHLRGTHILLQRN